MVRLCSNKILFTYTEIQGSGVCPESHTFAKPWPRVSLKLPNLSPKVAKGSKMSILRKILFSGTHPVSGYQEILACLKFSSMFSLRSLKTFCRRVGKIHTRHLLGKQPCLKIIAFIRDYHQSAGSNGL